MEVKNKPKPKQNLDQDPEFMEGLKALHLTLPIWSSGWSDKQLLLISDTMSRMVPEGEEWN